MRAILISLVALSSSLAAAPEIQTNGYHSYYNSYCSPYAKHFLCGVGSSIGVGLLDVVQLEDNSQWKINPYDLHRIASWLNQDELMITPNDGWFSSGGGYCVTNLSNGSYVRATLHQGPAPAGAYSHWIVAMDYNTGHVYLENGLIWSMAPRDRLTCNKWAVGDYIIIGSYQQFLGNFDHILINVNMNDCAQAKLY